MRFISVLIGCGILVGAVASWHYWNVAGWIAVIAGISGLEFIEWGLTGKMFFNTNKDREEQ